MKRKRIAIPLYRTILCLERMVISGTPPVKGSEVAAFIAYHVIGDSPVERLLVIYRGTVDDYRGCEIVAQGTMDASGFSLRDLFRGAIVANARTVVLAHNHPSGEVLPSLDDIETTRRAKVAGELLGINVVDHIIVSHTGDWHSLVDHGEMP